MVRRCKYVNCRNSDETHSLFRFPVKDKNRLRMWINNSGNVRLTTLTPDELNNCHLCEIHFDQCYISCNNTRNVLVGTAIPRHYHCEESIAVISSVPLAEQAVPFAEQAVQELPDANITNNANVKKPEVQTCIECHEPTSFRWWCLQCGKPVCCPCALRNNEHQLHFLLRSPANKTPAEVQIVIEAVKKELGLQNVFQNEVWDHVDLGEIETPSWSNIKTYEDKAESALKEPIVKAEPPDEGEDPLRDQSIKLINCQNKPQIDNPSSDDCKASTSQSIPCSPVKEPQSENGFGLDESLKSTIARIKLLTDSHKDLDLDDSSSDLGSDDSSEHGLDLNLGLDDSSNSDLDSIDSIENRLDLDLGLEDEKSASEEPIVKLEPPDEVDDPLEERPPRSRKCYKKTSASKDYKASTSQLNPRSEKDLGLEQLTTPAQWTGLLHRVSLEFRRTAKDLDIELSNPLRNIKKRKKKRTFESVEETYSNRILDDFSGFGSLSLDYESDDIRHSASFQAAPICPESGDVPNNEHSSPSVKRPCVQTCPNVDKRLATVNEDQISQDHTQASLVENKPRSTETQPNDEDSSSSVKRPRVETCPNIDKRLATVNEDQISQNHTQASLVENEPRSTETHVNNVPKIGTQNSLCQKAKVVKNTDIR